MVIQRSVGGADNKGTTSAAGDGEIGKCREGEEGRGN